jgi:hypothetical protein
VPLAVRLKTSETAPTFLHIQRTQKPFYRLVTQQNQQRRTRFSKLLQNFLAAGIVGPSIWHTWHGCYWQAVLFDHREVRPLDGFSLAGIGA